MDVPVLRCKMIFGPAVPRQVQQIFLDFFTKMTCKERKSMIE